MVVSTPSSPAAIPWHKRLEARLLISVTLIAATTLGAVLVATSRIVQQSSFDRAAHSVRDAKDSFNILVYTRGQAAAKKAQLITDLPTFRAHFSDSGRLATDRATVDATIDDYCRRLEGDFCIVSDVSGNWVANAGAPTGRGPAALAVSVLDTIKTGRPSSDIISGADSLYLIVSAPLLFSRELLGTFTIGFRLDDAVAVELARGSQSVVAFICAGRVVCGSSLPTRERAALVALLDRDKTALSDVNAGATRLAVGDTPYVGGVYPLQTRTADTRGVDEAAQLVLLQDWTPTEKALDQIYATLYGVGIVTFGVVVGGTLIFGRRATRPLRDLATAADRIASGDWSRRVHVKGPAEARTMAEAFNHMAVTLSHWHQQAQEHSLQLHESYERFRSVTDSANDAIISVNNRGDIVFWNLRAHIVFGYSEHEALGRSVTRLVPDRFLAEYSEQIGNLLGGMTTWSGAPLEMLGLRRDGSEVPLELSLSSWRTGDQVFYTGVLRDITERKQAAEALRQREEQLRQAQKMEAVGRLAGGIAHDFNNLLTAILGYADLLLEELPAGHPIRPDIEGVQKAGRSAASLTRELLAFSRKQVLQPIVLDMNDVVLGTENLLRRLLGEDIELILELEPRLDPVRADRSQLEQVLLNLAVNARDAMPSGGHVTIRTANVSFNGRSPRANLPPIGGPQVLLTVKDTGVGMSPEVRQHIFEPFFTTKEVGKGTGLGLATVYGIVQQSGGHIWVDSEVGKGTTLSVGLPAIEEAVTRAEIGVEASAPSRGGSETLLLVEDNDSVRALAREALTRYGYSVLEARNGEEGLRVATDNLDRIALVVTDIVMPLMGGKEMATRLTAMRKDLKVVFTSGYTTDAILRADAPGARTAFIQKPFTPALLGRTVRELLDAPVPVN